MSNNQNIVVYLEPLAYSVFSTGPMYTKSKSRISFFLCLADDEPRCTKSDDGPEYKEGQKVSLMCTLGFHGNHAPELEWIEPKLHVDYEHQVITRNSTENMVSKAVL